MHAEALRQLVSLADGDTPWGVPVFCFAEFLRVVTHPRIFKPPSSIEEAVGALEALLESRTMSVLLPGPRFPSLLTGLIRTSQASGNLVFDAQIAALCQEHLVDRLITLDRDFSRFPEIRTVKLDSPST